jgi:hypothetical protein
MSFSIDPARRSPPIRRKSAAEAADDLDGASPADGANLPVPVGRARTVPPKGPVAGPATIEAQLLGERRGLKAGASAIDQAKVSYNRTEWSGAWDRRTPKGAVKKTRI